MCWPLALWLRHGSELLENHTVTQILKHTVIYALLCSGIFLWTRLYRGFWRYVSLKDIISIVISVSYAVALYIPLMLIAIGDDSLPRSLPFLLWGMNICTLGGSRVLYRLLKDHKQNRKATNSSKEKTSTRNAIIFGATDEAELFIRQIQRQRRSEYKIAGVLDEKLSRKGLFIHGVEVLGRPQDLESILEKIEPIDALIMAHPYIGPNKIKDFLELGRKKGIVTKRLPAASEMASTLNTAVQARPISIEDLLSRPKKNLDRSAMASLIKDQRVLVTGAGGSIGSELVRQIACFSPAHICLVDHAEFLLYSIDRELHEIHPDLSRSMALCDVGDARRVIHIMRKENPELVFHAAALKHVPIAEDNPCETIITNAIGTRNVANACERLGIKTMVFVSTDKAINPPNVMGATKRLAESYCQALNLETTGLKTKKSTHFITVRFGNVLGSSGSVVPLFKRQISQGGPITITHPDVTRYFMTISEAVELILQAAALGTQSISLKGQIFVLDMGNPVKIIDLARQMIQLSGYQPGTDIAINVTGLRPGEKLYEELFDDREKMSGTPIEGLLLAQPRMMDISKLVQGLKKIEKTARHQDSSQSLKILKALVPEYTPKKTLT
ncbi:MAG: polysaccharide biosynthesis protein [bacterium]|nr:polysaccharide biosynthesis protein [bacterium]